MLEALDEFVIVLSGRNGRIVYGEIFAKKIFFIFFFVLTNDVIYPSIGKHYKSTWTRTGIYNLNSFNIVLACSQFLSFSLFRMSS